MEDEKLCPAMLRLRESTYYELRKIALDNRSTFNKFAGQILEQYVASRDIRKRPPKHEDSEGYRGV